MKKISYYCTRLYQEGLAPRFWVSRVLLFLQIDMPFTLIFNQTYTIKTRLHASSAAHKLFINKYKPYLDVAVFERYVKPDSTVVDVGANIGMFTTLAAKLSGTGMVYAFEATPKTFAYLLDNLAINAVSNVYPVFAAVSEETGVARMFEHAQSHEQNFLDTTSGSGTVVPTIRLDDFLASQQAKHIHFMKIDVEGAEQMVLRGLGERSATVAVLYLECDTKTFKRFGYTKDELIKELETLGFVVMFPSLVAGELQLDPYTSDHHQYDGNIIALNKTFVV